MIWEGRPFQGKDLEKVKRFLKKMDLEYDDGIEYSICILNNAYEIIGTGSVDQNVIKCVAIDPEYQGQGHSATILTNLIQYEFEQGRTHIFIYTKPENLPLFGDMGFHRILQTNEVLFMENQSQGFQRFLNSLANKTPQKAMNKDCKVGAVVANCNPFTLGHRYLVEYASSCCDYLHLFILSDNRHVFSADDRYEMVKLGIKGLKNVILHETKDYMISAATFPTYFFKEKRQGEEANCQLDLELFGAKIAPKLGITSRFVGTEPFCKVTDSYNRAMKRILPAYGIQIEEIERRVEGEIPVSASAVRKCLEKKEYEKVHNLVPESVYEYLISSFSQ
ncbi:[citrate (pro-3S)-lyase] ligase [Lachnospiraceae bacterium OttesenSCG-928-D06]|nr:[citrate (pro-3S)-lyase] ligase [Lachnospiraceae bacterium OttesenSCG-928-D06]